MSILVSSFVQSEATVNYYAQEIGGIVGKTITGNKFAYNIYDEGDHEI